MFLSNGASTMHFTKVLKTTHFTEKIVAILSLFFSSYLAKFFKNDKLYGNVKYTNESFSQKGNLARF